MKIALITILIYIVSITFIFGQSKNDSLIVFVGEKIEVAYSAEKKLITFIDTIISDLDTTYKEHYGVISDSRYLAKYKVLELINGAFEKDTIEFIVYDHYGEPSFSKYKNVLLFVRHYGDNLYHEKYQYFPLYLTTENKWASPYSYNDFNHSFRDSITIKPEKIQFKKEVSFYVSGIPPNKAYKWFPIPYYHIQNGKAIAMYGNYIQDLIKLKQETVLKARGIY